MFIISPLSRCASPEKADRFYEHLTQIARVTQDTEPQVIAYAWFRAAEDDNAIPAHYLRGLEVYETIEANQITHRASTPYKTFRSAVSQEGLLEQPSDLRFWHPTGIGFLTTPNSTSTDRTDRKEPAVAAVICTESHEDEFIVVYEIVPKPGQKDAVLERLRDVAGDCEGALSFWVLERGDGDGDGIYVFSRWKDRGAWEEGREEEGGRIMECLEKECEEWLCTKWRGRGLGFLARGSGSVRGR